MNLIITGATGVAGLNIYRAALSDPSISAITLLQRRPMPSWASIPPNTKTTTIQHTDFSSYPPDLLARLADADAVVWAQGRSSRGVQEEEYTMLTLEYPVKFLGALKEAGAGKGEGKELRFVYISGEGADPSEKSSQMWARVKGRAETALTSLSSTSPNLHVHIVRPGYFRPPRTSPSDWANQRTRLESAADRVLGPALGLLAPGLLTPLDEMARVVLGLAKGEWKEEGLVRNKRLRELAAGGV